MVMHPHTKYNWPIWKDKKVMVQTSFAEKKQKNKSDLNNMSPFIRRGDIIRLFCFSSVIYLNKSIILGKGTPW
jgi:hypothetical protein